MKWFFRILAFIFLVIIGLLASQYQADLSVEELAVKYTNSESEFIDILGMPVHYRVEGKGDPLLLIHGTSSSLHTWDVWTDELKGDFTVIRLDLPAFGLTGPKPDGDYSMDAYMGFIGLFLKKLGIEKCAIAGNSLGGAIAWNYALANQTQVEKLILIDASGLPRKEIKDVSFVFKLASTPILKDILMYCTPKSLHESSLKEVYADDSKVTDELVQRYFDMSLREGNRKAFVERINRANDQIKADPSKLKMPVMIMWGEEDLWVKLADAHRFSELIDDHELVIYPNVGHLPMEEIPVQSAKDAKLFLQKEPMVGPMPFVEP